MLGWIHESIRQLIQRKYGPEAWDKILDTAGMVGGEECIMTQHYSDGDTFKLVNSVSTVVGIPVEEIWEAYGGFLIQFTMETGWDELLRSMSNDLQGFLDNLDNLHYFIDHVVHKGIQGPSFRCQPNADGTLTLHYYSKRNGLYPIVKGVIREVSRRIYDIEVVMKLTERKQEELDNGVMAEHVIFSIKQWQAYQTTSKFASCGRVRLMDTIENEDSSGTRHSIISRSLMSLEGESNYLKTQENLSFLSFNDFVNAFPFHFCFDKKLMIEHVGRHIRQTLDNLRILSKYPYPSYPFLIRKQTKLTDLLAIEHPDVPMTFSNFLSFINGVFVFNMKEFPDQVHRACPLKGQMALVNKGQHMLYICSPNVQTVRGLLELDMCLSDLPRHDAARDLILLNQSRLSQVELNNKLEQATAAALAISANVEKEKNKTDALLRELLPASVAEDLRQGKTVEARDFEECSIVFTDIVTFTVISSKCTPFDVVNMLNDMFSRYDRLTTINDLYKVETIGDAYMVVAGAPEYKRDHYEGCLNMALGMLWETSQVMKPNTDPPEPVQIRAGVHSGPVVGGVVGIKMPRYCFFGDTISIAQNMESKGVPSKVQCSEDIHKLAIDNGSKMYEFEERGTVDIKNVRKSIKTYFLLKNRNRTVWELVERDRPVGATLDGYTELTKLSEAQPSVVAPKNGPEVEAASTACVIQ